MDNTSLKSLAKIGIGTKRKKREINLLEVAEEMKSLYDKHNSLEGVAKLVRLSPEMVRQFLRINGLDDNVKELIKAGLIKSVDIGYRISKLEKNDQAVLATFVSDKNLCSDDVRSIVKYKLDNPAIPIESAITRTIKSKDKKVYVAYFGIEKDVFERFSAKTRSKDLQSIVRRIFNSFLPKKSIVSFELNGRVVIIKVLREGLQKLREKAKMLRVPLANLTNALINVYLEGDKN